MNRCLLSLSVLCLLASGCSVNTTNNALGSFEYTKKGEGKDLVIPKGLKTPKKNQKFKIDPVTTQGPIGKALDIRSPSLVLPVAASSRLEQDSSKAMIWFDQVFDDVELYPFILKALEDQLKSDDVDLVTIDENEKRFQSTWYLKETESSDWFFTEISEIESVKFNYSFEVKPHGRSVAVEVEVAGFMRTDESGSTKEMGPIDKQRAEMNMLNSMIEQVDYNYRIHQHENRLLRSNQQLVNIDENKKAEPSFIVEMELEPLWANMPSFFEKHGFKVSDLNEPKKTYFVDFIKPENSIWAKLWDKEVPIIELEDGKYSFILREHGDDDLQTSVTIYQADGTALSAETLESISAVLSPGLSFKSIY
ncbi:MAG: outer membrane protein assembly factor BamC [Thalassotalea sp.]